MKRTTLILVLALIASNLKAQQVGLTADVGISKLNQTYSPYAGKVQNKGQLYYGLGFFYEKIPKSGNLGFKISLDYNKRGAKGVYENDFVSNQFGGDIYIEQETVSSSNAFSLTFLPTINASKKFQFYLGPHLTYALNNTSTTTVTYYKTEAKEEVLLNETKRSSYNGASFSDQLSFGLRVGVNFKIIDAVGIGLSYQYSRLLNNQTPFGEVPFYNIFNFSTHIYFNSNN